MEETVRQIQNYVMYGCFAALGLVGLFFMLKLVCTQLVMCGLGFIRNNPFWSVILVPAFICLFVYGSTKPVVRQNFVFGSGLTDNGSYASNNVVCAKWLYTGHAGTDKVQVSYKTYGEPDDTYSVIAEVYANEYMWQYTVVNASNYVYKLAFKSNVGPVDTSKRKIVVCTFYEVLPDSILVPCDVDIEIDGNGIFDVIPRPVWPSGTNTVESTEE